MKRLLAFYFSGTGNTRYVTQLLCRHLSAGYEVQTHEISGANHTEEIQKADIVMLAFPVYGSAPPQPMRDFLYAHRRAVAGKELIIVATQYLFSGDGAASLGRAAEKYGGIVSYAEHFRMPNNISDCPMLAVRTGEALWDILTPTDRKIVRFAARILAGKKQRRGFNPVSRAVGYFSQRALFRKHEQEKQTRLSVDAARCIQCGACVRACPVNNLSLCGGEIKAAGKCALCYRCVNLCPQKALKLFGKNPPKVQYAGPTYMKNEKNT